MLGMISSALTFAAILTARLLLVASVLLQSLAAAAQVNLCPALTFAEMHLALNATFRNPVRDRVDSVQLTYSTRLVPRVRTSRSLESARADTATRAIARADLTTAVTPTILNGKIEEATTYVLTRCGAPPHLDGLTRAPDPVHQVERRVELTCSVVPPPTPETALASLVPPSVSITSLVLVRARPVAMRRASM